MASEGSLNKPFLSFFHIGMDLSWPTIYQFPIILLGLMCCLFVQTGPKHNIMSVLPYKLYLRWSVRFTAHFSFWLFGSYSLLDTGAVGVIEQHLVLCNKHTNSHHFNLMRFASFISVFINTFGSPSEWRGNENPSCQRWKSTSAYIWAKDAREEQWQPTFWVPKFQHKITTITALFLLFCYFPY